MENNFEVINMETSGNSDEGYLKFRKGDQSRLLRIAKRKCFGSWEEFSDFLHVHRSMMFLYLSEKSKLPKRRFDSILKIAALEHKDFPCEFIPSTQFSKIPTMINCDVAEFIGIMLGDGSLNKNNYQITISCGEIDRDYIRKYIPHLIKKLFAKEVG